MTSPDHQIARLARRQSGCFTRAQAIDCGFTQRMMSHRLATGAWARLDTGIYALASHPAGWQQRYHAALLRWPDGALRGMVAAHVWGLDGFGAASSVHLTVPPGGHTGGRLAVSHRSQLLRPRSVNGFRVNDLPYVMLEIAADAPARLQPAYESAVLRRHLTFDRTSDVAVRASAGRVKGARALRTMLARLGDGHVPPESELERLLFALLESAGIAAYVRQAPLPWSPGGPQRVDVYIPAWRMIIEVDGRLWHARIAALANDAHRDNEALRHGIVTVRFGWAAVHGDPAGCAAAVLDTARSFGHLACA